MNPPTHTLSLSLPLSLSLSLSLIQPGTQTGGNLKPVILREILDVQRELVRRVVRQESAGPQEHVHLYDKYAPLVSRQAEEDVEQFLREKHSFQEMMMEVTRYQQMADEITFNCVKVRFTRTTASQAGSTAGPVRFTVCSIQFHLFLFNLIQYDSIQCNAIKLNSIQFNFVTFILFYFILV